MDERRDRPVLVFDGDCAICSSTARFAEGILRGRALVVAYQLTDLHPLGITAREGAEAVWWIEPDGRRFSGHQAVARGLRMAGGVWSAAGAAIDSPPVAPVSARVYGWVARNRHRLPGGTPACAGPFPDSGERGERPSGVDG